jgi:hypothetical protein
MDLNNDVTSVDYLEKFSQLHAVILNFFVGKINPLTKNLQQMVCEIRHKDSVADQLSLLRVLITIEEFLRESHQDQSVIAGQAWQLAQAQFDRAITKKEFAAAISEDLHTIPFRDRTKIPCFDPGDEGLGGAVLALLTKGGMSHIRYIRSVLPFLFEDDACRLLLKICPNKYWLYSVIEKVIELSQKHQGYASKPTHFGVDDICQAINRLQNEKLHLGAGILHVNEQDLGNPDTWKPATIAYATQAGWVLLDLRNPNHKHSEDIRFARLVLNPIWTFSGQLTLDSMDLSSQSNSTDTALPAETEENQVSLLIQLRVLRDSLLKLVDEVKFAWHDNSSCNSLRQSIDGPNQDALTELLHCTATSANTIVEQVPGLCAVLQEERKKLLRANITRNEFSNALYKNALVYRSDIKEGLFFRTDGLIQLRELIGSKGWEKCVEGNSVELKEILSLFFTEDALKLLVVYCGLHEFWLRDAINEALMCKGSEKPWPIEGDIVAEAIKGMAERLKKGLLPVIHLDMNKWTASETAHALKVGAAFFSRLSDGVIINPILNILNEPEA